MFFSSKLGKWTQTAFHHVERRGDNYAMSAKMLLKWVLVPISASLSSHHHVPCDVPLSVPLALCLIFAIFFSRAFLLPSFPSAALSKPLEIPRKVLFGRDHEKSAENGKREILTLFLLEISARTEWERDRGVRDPTIVELRFSFFRSSPDFFSFLDLLFSPSFLGWHPSQSERSASLTILNRIAFNYVFMSLAWTNWFK